MRRTDREKTALMETLQNFWALVVDVWDTGVLGISLGRVLVALLIVLFFLLLRRLFSRAIARWLRPQPVDQYPAAIVAERGSIGTPYPDRHQTSNGPCAQ
jgi:hypothetical protein